MLILGVEHRAPFMTDCLLKGLKQRRGSTGGDDDRIVDRNRIGKRKNIGMMTNSTEPRAV
jgi:hypothetical protein